MRVGVVAPMATVEDDRRIRVRDDDLRHVAMEPLALAQTEIGTEPVVATHLARYGRYPGHTGNKDMVGVPPQ